MHADRAIQVKYVFVLSAFIGVHRRPNKKGFLT